MQMNHIYMAAPFLAHRGIIISFELIKGLHNTILAKAKTQMLEHGQFHFLSIHHPADWKKSEKKLALLNTGRVAEICLFCWTN